jgi:hypothetical protein
MGDGSREGQFGGVNIGGSVGFVRGDMVGGAKVVNYPPTSIAEIDRALQMLFEKVGTAPGEVQPKANETLAALKEEVAKGKDANDGVVAKLADGLVKLVPGAASAVVSAFATPILGGVAGPITSFVLDRLKVEK